jgi:hypothetical protein
VNDVYFGKVPADRLTVDATTVYFRADGKHRSKIGLKVSDATAWLGSFDDQNKVLTLVHYTKPDGAADYVNSLWEIQKDPFSGDAINAYNDGPPAPGAAPLGPFYELETSSPAAALKSKEKITHTHTTFHIQGEGVEEIMKQVLSVSPGQVTDALTKN